MPRTKVTKSNKRNRDGLILEEKLRAYEIKMEAYKMKVEELGFKYIAQVDTALKLTMSAVSTKLLQMKMYEFFQLQLKNMSDYKSVNESIMSQSQSICNNTVPKMGNDEGYLTEEGSSGGPLGNSVPGPLHSARARRGLRSRSACEEPVVPGSARPKPILPGAVAQTQSDHSSRNKLRTPIASRTKAFSAERTPPKTTNGDYASSPSSPPLEFLRWPKPGEIVVSKFGTPILTHAKPGTTANVNIPIKDGVLSLRPKKLEALQPNFIEKIDAETLQQIRTLHQNLNVIMSMAEKLSPK